jgi:hypothetical protein
MTGAAWPSVDTQRLQRMYTTTGLRESMGGMLPAVCEPSAPTARLGCAGTRWSISEGRGSLA